MKRMLPLWFATALGLGGCLEEASDAPDEDALASSDETVWTTRLPLDASFTNTDLVHADGRIGALLRNGDNGGATLIVLGEDGGIAWTQSLGTEGVLAAELSTDGQRMVVAQLYRPKTYEEAYHAFVVYESDGTRAWSGVGEPGESGALRVQIVGDAVAVGTQVEALEADGNSSNEATVVMHHEGYIAWSWTRAGRGSSSLDAMEVLDDGSVVVAGTTTDTSGPPYWVARLSADGEEQWYRGLDTGAPVSRVVSRADGGVALVFSEVMLILGPDGAPVREQLYDTPLLPKDLEYRGDRLVAVSVGGSVLLGLTSEGDAAFDQVLPFRADRSTWVDEDFVISAIDAETRELVVARIPVE